MQPAVVLAVAAWNRWLLAFSVAAGAVLLGGMLARSAAQRVPKMRAPADSDDSERRAAGIRRRGGGLLALGPLIGLALAPTTGRITVVLALGGAGIAVFGMIIERSSHADSLALIGVAVAAAVAVAAGAELGPTGVHALDVACAFALIVGVTKAVDGLGHVDGLAAEMGAAAMLPLFAIAGFASQDGLAGVFTGTAAACIAFLAFNLRPASLFAGRGGRLLIGFVVALGALAVHPVPGAGRELATPVIVLAVFWFDALVVVFGRLRRRHSLLEHRSDHLVHRLAALGWGPRAATTGLLTAQVVLGGTALFTARAVMPVWLGLAIAAVVVLALAVEVARARLEREQATGLPWFVKLAMVLLPVAVVAAMTPLAFVAKDTVDLMQQGRRAATSALSAARDGDTTTARRDFEEAARNFAQARDKLESPSLAGGSAVPFVASNVRAAQALSEIGTDLARAGESITTAVHPDALQVVDGTLPLDEVRKVTPELERGSAALTNALTKLDGVEGDPYLLSQVDDALSKVRTQLSRAEAETRRAASAAKLAPALFGGDGPRRYLLVVQNNSESRATGGFIGNYTVMTAVNGKIEVGNMVRSGIWNAAVRADPNAKLIAPLDYLRRYTQFSPKTTVQNINMSPDFPSVGEALMSLTTAAGVGPVDGVMSVDPAGLAALLELSGPVTVDTWPTPIDAGNVVSVTLRDAYAVFGEDSAPRVDFLGDVAKAAVDQATSGSLGKPAELAKVLGKAAHEGHLTLAFSRPGEQRLAEDLGIAQEMRPVHSDAIAVTSSNSAGNKIDYYMKRDVRYRVNLVPEVDGTEARATADFSAQFDNTAPAEGLPPYVIGPYDARFVAGESRSFVSMYSPLRFAGASVDGTATAVAPGRERDRNVYSLFLSQLSMTKKTVAVHLDGVVKLHHGWYDLEVRHQPTLIADTVHVSVKVPEGWKIDRAPSMKIRSSHRATTTALLAKTTTYRVHVVRDPDTLDLWSRLEAGA
jgi:UDP-N-acetylmuramyl pentapeptide phosphotransferase/UDP-N-acetylglucosamine-1-phosphate transferase